MRGKAVLSSLLYVVITVFTLFFAQSSTAAEYRSEPDPGLNLSAEEKAFLSGKSELVLGYSEGFDPMFMVKSEGNYTGVAPDLYKLISERLGIKIRYEVTDWKTTLKKLHDCEVDIVPLMDSRTAQQNGTIVSDEIFEILAQVYVKEGSGQTVNSMTDLAGKKIAYNKHVLILNRFFEKYKGKMTLFGVENHLDAFRMLENGKVDAVVAFNTSNYLLPRHFLNDIKPVYILNEIIIKTVSAIRPDAPVLRSIINKAIRGITNEEKNAIGSKWIGISSNQHKLELTAEEQAFLDTKKVLRVSNEPDYEPIDFNVDGKATGFSIDLLEKLLRDTGLKVSYVTLSGQELFDKFENGQLDILHSIYKTKEREEKGYLFTKRYLHGDLVYITHKDSKDVHMIEELFGQKVGVTKGWYHEEYVRRYPQIQRVYYKNLEDKLKALSNREVDAIINTQLEASYYIHKYGYTNLKMTKSIDEDFQQMSPSLHMAVPKSEPLLLSILNKAMSQLSVAEMQGLHDKWLGVTHTDTETGRLHLTPDEHRFLGEHGRFAICDQYDIFPVTGVQNNKIVGIQGDIFDNIAGKLDVSFTAIPGSSRAELEQKAAEGQCDMVSVLARGTKRFENMKQTDVVYTLYLTVIGNLQSPYFREKTYLHGHQYYTSNPDYIKPIREQYPEMDIRYSDDIDSIMQKVESNSDVHYVDVQMIADKIIQMYGLNKFKQNGILEKVKVEVVMGVSDKYPELLSILNKSIWSLDPQFISDTLDKYTVKEFKIVKGYAYLRYVAAVFVLIAIFVIYQAKQNKKIRLQNKIIQEQTKEQELLFNSTPIPICFVNSENMIIKRNQEFIKLFGYSHEKVPTLAEWFPMAYPDPAYRASVLAKWNRLVDEARDGDGYISADTYNVTCSDGVVRSIIVDGVLHNDGFIATFNDISEMVEKDQLLLKQSRLAIMGEMISMIAHQWRQPLSAIMGIMGNMYDLSQSEDIDRKEIENLVGSTEDILTYMSGTIDDFRNFYNQSKEKESFSILQCVYESVKMIRPQLDSNRIKIEIYVKEPGGERSALHFDFANRTGFHSDSRFIIKGHINEFQQVLLSILSNAKDALLSVKSEKVIVISIEAADDHYLVNIKDSGVGIPADNLAKIFEPYFTTKKDLNGTGIGLYMSKMVIEKSFSGTIKLESEPDNGASFTIALRPFKET